MNIEEKRARYLALGHAMQSGVAYSRNKINQEPKHLRVGINTAHVAIAGLAKVLIQKGIITEEEYWDGQIASMEEEVERYKQLLGEEYGTDPSTINLA